MEISLSDYPDTYALIETRAGITDQEHAYQISLFFVIMYLNNIFCS